MEKIVLIEGENMDIQCIFEGIPPPTISWSKDEHGLGAKVQVSFFI